ncbi:isochorismatase family protein [Candidatus Falkowbacteria bacterium]|nr:isochorismatase family protein [Candidatus Falkowbacteria bacterium]
MSDTGERALRIKKVIGKVLIVVDPQLDFMEGGSLPVKGGLALVPRINDLMARGDYDLIIISKDCHPKGHYSFASRHDKKVGEVITRNGYLQLLFEDHCVIGTDGTLIHPDLDMSRVALIIMKGMDINVDSFSAFFSAPDENGYRQPTGLSGFLEAFLITKEIDVVCLAFDFCVKATAIDAAQLGYKVRVLKYYCASVFPENDNANIIELERAGVRVVL